MSESDGKNTPSASFASLASICTAAQIERLAGYWITTPAQLLSSFATAEGRAGIGTLLELNEAELETLLSRFKDSLPQQTVAEFSSNRPGGNLGALISPRHDKPGTDTGEKPR